MLMCLFRVMLELCVVAGPVAVGQITVSGSATARPGVPSSISPETAIQKLVPDASTQPGEFGVSLAMTPGRLVIGSAEGNAGVAVKGAVYVYELIGCNWTRTTKLYSPGTAGSAFGVSVAIDGDTIVVGARGEGSNGEGAVYVYEWDGKAWLLAAELKPSPATAPLKEFGYSVAVDGDTIVVGLPKATCGSALECGTAYVYVRPGANWRDEAGPLYEATRLVASSGIPFEQMGQFIALDRGLIVATASHLDGGSVYVFKEPAAGWATQPVVTESARLLPTVKTGIDDSFGVRADVHRDDVLGDLIAVGAWATDHLGTDSGVAYVVREPPGGWSAYVPSLDTTVIESSTLSAGDFFGTAVRLDGNRLTVGAFADDSPVGGQPGHGGRLFVFEQDGTQWVEKSAIEGLGKDLGGLYTPGFGYDASLRRHALAVSAVDDDNSAGVDAGAVYVFNPMP